MDSLLSPVPSIFININPLIGAPHLHRHFSQFSAVSVMMAEVFILQLLSEQVRLCREDRKDVDSPRRPSTVGYDVCEISGFVKCLALKFISLESAAFGSGPKVKPRRVSGFRFVLCTTLFCAAVRKYIVEEKSLG